MSTAKQPISRVEWIDRNELHANDYNPNHVAPPELRLLKLSIIENGWTQPIVARVDNEIVDGYHRWLVSADSEIGKLTDNLVPVVRLADVDPASQRMATIRHNRARGVHHVLRMAEIVNDLASEYELDAAEIGRRLQMDEEEVDRLMDRGNMLKRGSRDDFGKGWAPE